MCDNCNVLFRKVEELDAVLRQTITTVNVQKARTDKLEESMSFIFEVAEKQNGYIDRLITVVDNVQKELNHVHAKVCKPDDGVVKLPIQNRLLH